MESIDKDVLDKLPLDKDLLDKLVQTFPPEYFKKPNFLLSISDEETVRSLFSKPTAGHFLAAPLVDVFHVHMFNKYNLSCQIHGVIQIIDGQGYTFTLYNRVVDMPEIVSNGGTLTLTMPKSRPIIPSNVVKLIIDLKARFEDEVETIKDSRTWGYTIMDDYDNLKSEIVNGVHCWADVRYVTYRHADFSIVDLILVKEEDCDENRNTLPIQEKVEKNCNTVEVYGTIVARFGGNHSAILFDRKPNEPTFVEYGAGIILSRHALAVPACSSLVIHAHLWDADTKQLIVDKGCEFRVIHCGTFWQKVEGQNCLIQFQVEWTNAYLYPPPQRRVEEDSIVDLRNRKMRIAVEPERLTMEVMEVFSVSVHSNRTKELNLWGSITFTYPERLVFDRKETSPQRLLPNQDVPLVFPERCFVDSVFQVFLDLKDVDGHVISNGAIEWDPDTVGKPISWYGKLLCSVIRGDDGSYAAVHYAMFAVAVQATVTICLNGNNSGIKFFKIDGCVRSQYSNFKYLTIYEKEFYRRKLFVSHIEDTSWEYSGSEIILSKSAVAVAEGSTLIVDVNLKVIPEQIDCTGNVKIDEQAAVTFEQKLEFRPGMGCHRIKRESNEIVVNVEWSDVL